MKIAMSKTREQFPLSKKKPLKKTLPDIIISPVIFIILLVAGPIAAPYLPWTPSLTVISLNIIAFMFLSSCPLVYLYQVWYFQVYFYDLTDDFIIIKKGLLTPKEITIPYERVQDVYVDQDILDRILGLYDVHLSSATISSGIEAHIDGVKKESADGLRQMILGKVSEKIKKEK
jgi:membrane protein YdbS with pleckstrin-like domain